MTRDRLLFVCASLALLFQTRPIFARDEETATTKFRILVPESAVVLIDGEKMRSTGPERVFNAPALAAGRTYRYEFRVRHEGQEVVRLVRFEPGRAVEVDFRPDFRKSPMTPELQNWRRPIRPLGWLPRRVFA